MRLTLDSIAVLDAIDRRGSFAAAADELHRVPSAITYAVQKLEEDLGVAIFDRSGHRAQLTAAGKELLREGRHLLAAAAEIEARTRRVATGYEVELRIVVDDLIPLERILPLCEEFYREQCGTRLRLGVEVFGGSWDALVSGRADLVIGAAGDGPAGGGYATQPLGSVPFVFVVAPEHPLATEPEPLAAEQIMQYRAIAAADSSRNLPPRTAGLLSGQDLFAVPDMRAKVAAQVAGLGVGSVPAHFAAPEIAAGRLVAKRIIESEPGAQLATAWRTTHQGKALQWFVQRLRDPERCAALLADLAD